MNNNKQYKTGPTTISDQSLAGAERGEELTLYGSAKSDKSLSINISLVKWAAQKINN